VIGTDRHVQCKCPALYKASTVQT